jgi:uncharacterized membrane protein
MADSINRSIAKTITWRIIAVCITMLVTYFVLKGIHPEWSSHQYREASMIVGAADLFIKMFAYFVHERIWTKVKI